MTDQKGQKLISPEVKVNQFKTNWKFYSEHSGVISAYDTSTCSGALKTLKCAIVLSKIIHAKVNDKKLQTHGK